MYQRLILMKHIPHQIHRAEKAAPTQGSGSTQLQPVFEGNTHAIYYYLFMHVMFSLLYMGLCKSGLTYFDMSWTQGTCEKQLLNLIALISIHNTKGYLYFLIKQMPYSSHYIFLTQCYGNL